MTYSTKREIEHRIEEFEDNQTPSEPAKLSCWLIAGRVPKKLWDDNVEAWEYFITEGDSHPDLECEWDIDIDFSDDMHYLDRYAKVQEEYGNGISRELLDE
ncbi:MAG: hypothetical protein ABEI52_08530 [Halobacteriaceae archaeon]